MIKCLNRLVLAGTGGFALEVADLVEREKKYDLFGVVSKLNEKKNKHFSSKVLGLDVEIESIATTHKLTHFFIALGDPTLREQVYLNYSNTKLKPAQIRDPASCCLSKNVGFGCIFYPLAILMTSAEVGKGCVFNAGSYVGHETIIGNFVNINPGARIAGNVKIGDRSTIGIGASIIENVIIGNDVTVGAGSVVLQDIPDNVTVAGTPARVLKS